MLADAPARNPLKRAYTFDEARVATTFSRQWWYKQERLGHIPPLIRIGGKTLVPVEVIDAILNGKLDLKDGHRAAHWHAKPQPQPRRRGRPRKHPKPESSVAAE